MRKISYHQRIRIVSLYVVHKLQFRRDRFHLLKALAETESIFTTERTIRRIVKHWLSVGSIEDKKVRLEILIKLK